MGPALVTIPSITGIVVWMGFCVYALRP